MSHTTWVQIQALLLIMWSCWNTSLFLWFLICEMQIIIASKLTGLLWEGSECMLISLQLIKINEKKSKFSFMCYPLKKEIVIFMIEYYSATKNEILPLMKHGWHYVTWKRSKTNIVWYLSSVESRYICVCVHMCISKLKDIKNKTINIDHITTLQRSLISCNSASHTWIWKKSLGALVKMESLVQYLGQGLRFCIYNKIVRWYQCSWFKNNAIGDHEQALRSSGIT